MPLYIDALIGGQSYEKTSAMLHMYYCPQPNKLPDDAKLRGKEVHLGQIDKLASTSVSKVSALPFLPYVGVNAAIAGSLGKWWQSRYAVEDGAVIKIHGQRVSWGVVKKANLYIRIREGAAVTQLTIDLPSNQYSRFQTATVKGNFDLLTLDEVDELGISIPSAFVKLSNPSAITGVFATSILVPASQTKPKPVPKPIAMKLQKPKPAFVAEPHDPAVVPEDVTLNFQATRRIIKRGV